MARTPKEWILHALISEYVRENPMPKWNKGYVFQGKGTWCVCPRCVKDCDYRDKERNEEYKSYSMSVHEWFRKFVRDQGIETDISL